MPAPIREVAAQERVPLEPGRRFFAAIPPAARRSSDSVAHRVYSALPPLLPAVNTRSTVVSGDVAGAGSGHWCASAGRSARVCGAPRSSRRRGSASSIGCRRMGCKLQVRGHGRVAVACDAADGAALEVCGVQLVPAERLPAVAVPQPRLFPHSAFGLDVRVEHDQTALLIQVGLWRRAGLGPCRTSARSVAGRARSRRSSARRSEARRPEHRVGAIADRQLGRIDAVRREPRLDRGDDLDDRP